MEDKNAQKIQVFLLDESNDQNENNLFIDRCYLKAAQNEIVFLTANMLREQFPAEENCCHGEFKLNCFAMELTLISYFISIFEVLNNCVPEIRNQHAKQPKQAVNQLKHYLENIIFFLDESEIDMIKPGELLKDEIAKLADETDYIFAVGDEVNIEEMIENIENIVAIFKEMAIKLSIELANKNVLNLPDSIKLHLGFHQEYIENFFLNLGKNPVNEYLETLSDLRSQVFITRILEISQLHPGKILWVNMNSYYSQCIKVALEENYSQTFEVKCFTAEKKWKLAPSMRDLLSSEIKTKGFDKENGKKYFNEKNVKRDADEEESWYSFESSSLDQSEENSGDEEESIESFGNKSFG